MERISGAHVDSEGRPATQLVARIEVELHKKVKILGVRMDKTVAELITEALVDLLAKYKKRATAEA